MTDEEIERLALAVVGAAKNDDRRAMREILNTTPPLSYNDMRRLAISLGFLALSAMSAIAQNTGVPLDQQLLRITAALDAR